MSNRKRVVSPLRPFTILLLAAGLAGTALACGDALSDDDIAEIRSASIQPDQVSKSNAGMTDECFTVEMTVNGFQQPIEEITIFIVEDDDRRVPASSGRIGECTGMTTAKFEIEGNEVVVGGIRKSGLVGGLDPGTFGIGATVRAEDGSEVTQRDITSIEITE